jgi:hypothetical protein
VPAELLEPVVYFLAYWTGKPVVRILSLGRLHVAFLAEPSRREKQKLRWYSVTFMHDGKRYLDGEAVCLVGVITWAIVIAAIMLISRRW